MTEVDGIGKTYAIYHPHTIYHNTNYRKLLTN
nr:MAG TPA: Emerin [Microviridae sp.]